MKEIGTEELKQLQLDILIKLDAFCREYGINYSLSSGTLIGAVRHRGYIPWDDDIDLYILRCDYERLEKVFKDDYLRLLSISTSKDCIYSYAKLYDSRTRLIENSSIDSKSLGVNIDLFIIDSVPDDIKDRQKLFKKTRFLEKLIVLKLVKLNRNRAIHKNVSLLLGKVILLFVSIHGIINRKLKLVGKFNPEAKEVCNIMGGNPIGSCIPMEYMKNFIDIEFEGHKFRCMKDYDTYLRKCYGDYMELPPEKERVTHHSFKAYWKNEKNKNTEN